MIKNRGEIEWISLTRYWCRWYCLHYNMAPMAPIFDRFSLTVPSKRHVHQEIGCQWRYPNFHPGTHNAQLPAEDYSYDELHQMETA
jgi:hypothetical protein